MAKAGQGDQGLGAVAGAPWAPTHLIPPTGAGSWSAPDPASPPKPPLLGGMRVALLERRADWAHVQTQNGWTGWVDGRQLVPAPVVAAPAPPAPVAPTPVAAAPAPVAPAPVAAAPAPVAPAPVAAAPAAAPTLARATVPAPAPAVVTDVPPVAPAARSRTPIIVTGVALVVVLIAAIGGGAFLLMSSHSSSGSSPSAAASGPITPKSGTWTGSSPSGADTFTISFAVTGNAVMGMQFYFREPGGTGHQWNCDDTQVIGSSFYGNACVGDTASLSLSGRFTTSTSVTGTYEVTTTGGAAYQGTWSAHAV